jgi:hypothetical protein
VSPQEAPVSKVIHAVHGGRIRIEAVVLDDGSCPAEAFLQELGESDTAKMMALFSLFVERFPKRLSSEKFKCFQIRMPCFFSGHGRVLLTHGLIKKADRLRAGDIKRAREIKATFERSVKAHG